MIPASGSHQNTWHSNLCVPPSTITAKVWLSWPTPRKVRNLTWHSQSGSAPSCGVEVTHIRLDWAVLMLNLLLRVYSTCTSPFHRDRTLSVTWITVGSQSSLSVEFIMLSMARFSTSIPATQRAQVQQLPSATTLQSCGDIWWPVNSRVAQDHWTETVGC